MIDTTTWLGRFIDEKGLTDQVYRVDVGGLTHFIEAEFLYEVILSASKESRRWSNTPSCALISAMAT